MPFSRDRPHVAALLGLLVAVLAVASLRFVYGPFAAQGLLFVAVTAIAAWWFGPGTGFVAAVLGLLASHVARLVEAPGDFQSLAFVGTRQYWVGLSAYALLCAVAIALGRWRQAARLQLDAVQQASDAAEATYRRDLEAALARETAARQAAERANDRAEDLQRRLLALVEASSTLLRSPAVDDVVAAMVALARDVLPADACAVWRGDGDEGEYWRVLSAAGVHDDFASSAVWPRAMTHFDAPWPVHALDTLDLPLDLRSAFTEEGFASMLAVPLLQEQRLVGLVTFYYRRPRLFPDADLHAARAFGNLASAALTTAELYDLQRRTRTESEFLADAGVLLSSSLDSGASLQQVARLAVPHFADVCAIDLQDTDGRLTRLALERTTPPLPANMPTAGSAVPGVSPASDAVVEVIRSGTPFLSVASRRASTGQPSPSMMIVPMVTRDRPFGAMTFALEDQARGYSRDDLRVAEALASRVALAVDNARAYQEATRANRLKDEFLAVLSHELRTPLNAVLGYTRMLGQGVIAEERLARAFATLERNAHVLSRIVEDVLEVSRFMAGKVTLRRAPVDLPAIVEQVTATVMPSADQKQVRLSHDIQRPFPLVDGDGDRLQQVVFNLLSNAVKFTGAGGTVLVRLAADAAGVSLVVADSGQGISPEFLPFVFDRFRQADASVTREHGGLGLGLAITRDIIELHHGRIDVASPGPGLGAEFRVRLPLSAPASDPLERGVVAEAALPTAAHADSATPQPG